MSVIKGKMVCMCSLQDSIDDSIVLAYSSIKQRKQMECNYS